MSIEDDVALLERVPTLRLLGNAALRMLAIGSEQRDFARGDFQPLHAWLRTNLFRHGKRFSTAEWAGQIDLSKSSTALNVRPLLARLDR